MRPRVLLLHYAPEARAGDRRKTMRTMIIAAVDADVVDQVLRDAQDDPAKH